MAKDYAKTKKSKGTHQTPGWVWLATGLLVGLFVAGLVYLRQHTQEVKEAKALAKLQPVKKHAAAKQTKISKPRFDFYTILPNTKVGAPVETGHASKPASAKVAHLYSLQVASFRRQQDAEQMRATMILQGFNVEVNKREHKNSLWYRVMVGPFDSKHAAKRVAKVLAARSVKSLLVKGG